MDRVDAGSVGACPNQFSARKLLALISGSLLLKRKPLEIEVPRHHSSLRARALTIKVRDRDRLIAFGPVPRSPVPECGLNVG